MIMVGRREQMYDFTQQLKLHKLASVSSEIKGNLQKNTLQGTEIQETIWTLVTKGVGQHIVLDTTQLNPIRKTLKQPSIYNQLLVYC